MEINTEKQRKITHIGQLLPSELAQPVNYDDVELTDEERISALNKAREKKYSQLEFDRKKRLAQEKAKDLRRPWTPNELYEYARGRASSMIREESGNQSSVFEPVDFQRNAITAMSLYFSDNPEFENLDTSLYNENPELKFSLQKGLWLWSDPGCGKTLMMQMFSRNKKQCYRVVQCPKIVSGYVKFGEDHTNDYTHIINASSDEFNYFQGTQGVCYNDLGTEPPKAKHFGNDINVMEMIFLDSYERKVPFWHRHVTTNLKFDQVKEMYGARFADRIKQMFNIIQINGKSLRK